MALVRIYMYSSSSVYFVYIYISLYDSTHLLLIAMFPKKYETVFKSSRDH